MAIPRLIERVASGSGRGSPDASHAAAALDLFANDTTGAVADRSVDALQAQVETAGSPALLSDLAAAHLVRAEQRQAMQDLLLAYETAERAREMDPIYAPALFNRALALDRLNLIDQAKVAWGEYLAVDSVSEWAGEARRRAAALRWTDPRGALPVPSWSAERLEAFVRAEPQEARQFGWEHALGEWGDAVVSGDTTRAAHMLGLAFRLGEVLERRGGDATLAGAVRTIRGERRRAALRALARDHRAYARGRAAYDSARYRVALDSFSRMLQRPVSSSPLYAWARVFHAASTGYEAPGRAEPLARAAIDTLLKTGPRPGALEGKARWVLGTLLLRTGRYPEALGEFRLAEARFAAVRETENVGATAGLQGETLQRQGERDAGYAALQRAGLLLRPYRRSVWLHNLMLVTAEAAAASGAPRAAGRLIDEDVAVTRRIPVAAYLTEARLRRVGLLAAAGDHRGIESELAAARRSILRLDSGYMQEWFTAELQVAAAAGDVRSEPARTRARLDSAVAFWRGRRNTFHQLPAFLSHARWALVLGDRGTARSDLRKAVALVEEAVQAEPRPTARARLLTETRGVFDELAKLLLSQNDAVGALEVVERGRPSFVASAPRGPALPRVRDGVALSYAIIQDSLYIWSMSESTITLTRTPVRQRELAASIVRVQAAMERYDDGPALSAGLDSLYDRLVRPVWQRLGRPGAPLVIVADGMIAGVPFAALRDARRGRHLLEDHPLRLAASLRDAAAPGLRAGRRNLPLLIADPAFNRRRHVDFERLPGAADEVRRVRTLYPRAPVLEGEAATREALVARLGGATLVHYAGHSVADDRRPEDSYLLLAGGPAAEDRLTAVDVETLDLKGVRLVVLSACQTLRGTAVPAGGLSGLSGAFLSAGAGGVVGSLWRIDDGSAAPLMAAFHREYRTSGDAAWALRAAQLASLRSADSRQRSPSTWAAFRYAGVASASSRLP